MRSVASKACNRSGSLRVIAQTMPVPGFWPFEDTLTVTPPSRGNACGDWLGFGPTVESVRAAPGEVVSPQVAVVSAVVNDLTMGCCGRGGSAPDSWLLGDGNAGLQGDFLHDPVWAARSVLAHLIAVDQEGVAVLAARDEQKEARLFQRVDRAGSERRRIPDRYPGPVAWADLKGRKSRRR